MKLEKQVTNLEISKRLKELNVKQESLWYWWYGQMSKRWNIHKGLDFNPQENGKDRFGVDIYSAFTVAELALILSRVEYESFGFPCLQIIYDQGITKQWHVHYRNPPLKWVNNGSQDAGRDVVLSNALGKMLIYLLENKLMEIKP